MVRCNAQTSIYAPLYIHTFRFIKSYALTRVEEFLALYPSPSQIKNTSDKLRYYRYRKVFLQRDVAKYAGIDRGTYSRYEKGIDYYPLDTLSKIAQLFEIEITDLLDDYNLFLINGQGEQIKKIRKDMRLTQTSLAQRMGVHQGTVKRWENQKIRISKNTYQKLMSMLNS
ncbi:MAG: helix-turn-helix transcriptional regulator [Bacillota bacterium]